MEQTPVKLLCDTLKAILTSESSSPKDKLEAAKLIAKVTKRRRRRKNTPKQHIQKYTNQPVTERKVLADLVHKVV